MEKIKWLPVKLLIKLESTTKKIILPGFDGRSLYDVGTFFLKGITEGALSMRAGSVAFSFFTAIFPALIFFLSLIPFIPIDNFQYELFLLLESILPQNAYELFYNTISDTLMNQRSSVLSIGFLLMLLFASNGIVALIDAFNSGYHIVDTRSWLGERLISIGLVFILSFTLIIAVALIVMGNNIYSAIIEYYPTLDSTFASILYSIIKWLIIILLFFLAISILYYLAPAKKERYKFISPGAIFATIGIIIAVLVFTFYVNNFSSYNKLYGSIGTIIVVMLLFYITALVLILGFDLNIGTNAIREKNMDKVKVGKAK